jgi:glycosyltransferase involved in cell wall biosynthesis
MKVIYLITNSDLSGAPIHLLNLSKGMSEKHEILVVFGITGPITKQFDKYNIPYKVIGTMKSDFNIINDIISLYRFIRICNEFKPDLIHSHSTKAGMIARITALLTRSKSVFTVHGWGFGEKQGRVKSLIILAIEKLLYFLTDYYIFVSNNDEKIAKQKFGQISGEVIYNGSDFSISNINAALSLNIIMVARNDPQKDYGTLLKALRNSDFNSAQLVGNGTNNEEFIFRAKNLLKEKFNKVEFLGEREDVSQLLENSNLFILTTNYEGLPISIIEAMSKGLPIIATNVGGISELVRNNWNGYLVNHADHVQLSGLINYLSINPQERIFFGKNSQNHFQNNFTDKKMVKKTMEVYKKVFEK